jgi:hypothetical protein
VVLAEQSGVFFQDAKTQASALTAKLHANSSIPYSIILSVMHSFNQIASSCKSLFQKVLQQRLTLLLAVMERTDERLEPYNKPVYFFTTWYRINKYFDNHYVAVKPQKVCFGSRLESHDRASKSAYDTFEYISVWDTLSSLLRTG